MFLVAGSAAAQTAAWPAEGPPSPLPAREVQFPPYQVQTLPNGLQVVAVMHHEQPAVSMRLLVRTGSASDPKGKLGLAHLLASLLDQGTTTKSADQLADTIDTIGGVMGTSAATDLTHVGMVVMTDSFEVGLRMMSDMVRHPAFSPAEIDRQRQQILSSLQVNQQDPAFVANAVFDRLVYGFHPYGMPATGTAETIAAITRDDLVRFHERHFAPNNAILAIVGDVTAERAFELARSVFGDWARRDLPTETFAEPPPPTRRAVVIDKPDAVQTEIRVGQIGIPRKHADYMAVNLAIRILGGEGSNRLQQTLRSERGLTYGAEASFDTYEHTGDFEAQTNTRSEATGEALWLVINEFWRLQQRRVADIELTQAQAYLTGSFPLTIETPDQIAMQVLNLIFYGLPLEELQTFRQSVNAVTVDDIQRVARQYLKPDRLSIVLVGNASTFVKQLDGLGVKDVEVVSLDDLDLTTSDFKRARSSAANGATTRKLSAAGALPTRLANRLQSQQSTTRTQTTKGESLLDRALGAKGGVDKLKAIKTITAVQTIRNETPEGAFDNESTSYLAYPDRFRVETRLPEGLVVQAYDGGRAWMKDPLGVHDAPDAMSRDAGLTLRRDVISLLLAAASGALQWRELSDVREADGKVYHALEVSAVNFEPVVMYLDPDSNLIARLTFVAGGPGRPMVQESFFDYRPVDGVAIAFRAVRRAGPVVVERRVREITINASLDPTLFKRPAP